MKISVIVPAYNCAAYIEKCIDSLLIQKGAEMEIIVVNDGSPDNLLEVLEKYENKIKLISIENGGVANARNVGLKYANGDFVMFVDSDDSLSPDCIKKIAEKQRSCNADIVRFGYRLIFADGSTALPINRFEREELIEKKDFKDKIYKNYINGIRLNSICMTLFKKETLSGLEFRKDMKTAEDAVFSMRAYLNAERVLIMPEEYYFYYRSSSGLTGNGLSVLEKYKCNIIFSKEIIKLLPLWGMNNPIWYIRAALRPVILTFDKLKRIKSDRKNH